MHQAGSPKCQIRTESHRPVSHLSSVIAATPAKKITFFKSGDPQFSGVRMAIHKRSFKCFDALLDDLSQKVPLPFGVRTITTQRGTHSIQHLDQLKDGCCYLCSDHQYVKPINMEAAGRHPVVWNSSHNTQKNPSRPEEPPTRQMGQHYSRHLKRIVLVKNSDPTVRRSITLSRRMARSLRVFMEEISELMQCQVKKLYTIEGRKIDSTQSLLQSPNVLVCVGREAFKPLLLENLWKNSEEKLPVLGTRSHTSTCSDGHDSKKNENFGLKTKKSIIHPRSDSSTKSARFSISSEKSYPNGSGMMTRQPGGIPNEVLMNDDIEKKVFVNKDGSLSVEMKVCFRLVDDETLQWSTEIKKLPSNTNQISFLKNRDPQYFPDKIEYSDPEYNSACEAEEAGASTFHLKHLNESYCENYCTQDQGYDIWKNPAHNDNGAKSACSSGSSHKISHHKKPVDSVCTSSRSSEEYTKHVVEKASCFEQTVKESKTEIKYCSVSRCCSRNEVTATASKLNCNIPTDDCCMSNSGNICQCQLRTVSFAEFNQRAQDYYSSNLSQSNPEQDNQCIDCCNSHAPGNIYLSPGLHCSTHASTPTINRWMHRVLDVQHQQKAYSDVDGTDSTMSLESSRSYCCKFNCQGEITPTMVTSNMQGGLGENPQIVEKLRTKETALIDGSKVQETIESDCKNVNSCANTSISGRSSKSTLCSCSGSKRSSTQSEDIQVADKDGKVESCKCTHCNSQTAYSSLIPKNVRPVHTPQKKVLHNRCECAISALLDVSTALKQSEQTACDRSMPADFTDVKKISASIMSVQLHESKIKGNKPVRATNSQLEKQNTHVNEKNRKIIAQALDKHSQEQVPSTMIESTKHSETNNIQKHVTLSPTSSSPGLDTCQENKHLECSNTVSRCSQVSNKSNTCSGRDSKLVLNHKNTSEGIETRLETNQSSHFLPVSSPSPKTKTHISKPCTPKSLISTEANDRAQSTFSVNSKASLKSGQSNKCHCLQSNGNVQENNKCGQSVAKSSLKISPTLSSFDQSNEPLSPSSTASVSLGFGEDENEGSICSRSGILNKNRCPSKKSAPEPAPEISMIVKTKHRGKTATSVSSRNSMISKLSHDLEDQCKNELATSPILLDESQIKKKKEVAEVFLNEDKRVSSALSEKYYPKSPCSGSQHNDINFDLKQCEGGQAASVKATPAKASKVKVQCTTKIHKTSSSLDNKESNKTTSCYSNGGGFAADKRTCEQEQCNSVVLENVAIPVDETTDNNLPPRINLNLSGLHVLNEKPVNRRAESRGSRSNSSSTTKKHRKCINTLEHKALGQGQDQLMPSSLPSTSPTEVINNWLRNIPYNGPTYELVEELIDKHDEAVHQIPAMMEESHLLNEIDETERLLEIKPQIKGFQLTDGGSKDSLHQKGSIINDESKLCDDAHNTSASSDFTFATKLSRKEGSTNHCQSSIHVMKLLLNPKLDQCNSLPEVSSTYERKLSTSTQGLLDCLANLQVIGSDFSQHKGVKYNDILNKFHSLWLFEHSKAEHDTYKVKDRNTAYEGCNPKSSSGVDLSIDLIGSTKCRNNGGSLQSKATQSTITPIAEQKACVQTQEDTVMESKDDSLTDLTPKTVDISPTLCDPLTPDIAERVRCSPEVHKLDKDSQKEALTQDIKSMKNTKVAKIFSPEDTKSGTSSSGQTGELTKRVSQDPDPVWILGLLKKIEQQFMSHYANAIAEFKVKWDLNDSETLDAMICELKEEVHKRIQSTINRELQKIQGRGGRTPRPPMSTRSRESSVQTEQRRRRLKVMPNKFVNISFSRSEGLNTGLATELSEQRSDDEYCPCDTCMKKKIACSVVQRYEAPSLPPVLMDFDLKKILQKKKDPPENTPMLGQAKYFNVLDKKNLKVVPEEDEVTHMSQKDKNRTYAAAFVIHTKYKNVSVNLNLASENQGTEVVVSSNGAEAVQKVLFDDGNKSQEGLEEKLNKKREREAGRKKSVKSTNNKDEKDKETACTFDEMAEKEAAQVENKETIIIDLEVTKNYHPDEEAEIKETQNSDIKEQHHNEKGDMNNITSELEDEILWEGIDEKAALVEVKMTEVDSESFQVCKTSAEQLSEVQNGNERSNTEKHESEKINEDHASSKESEPCNDNHAEPDADEDSDEGTKKEHQDNMLEEGLITSEQVYEEGEDKQGMELEDQDIDQVEPDLNKIDSDQNQGTGETGQICSKDCDPRLFQQVTKTSVESQPGSLESCSDLKKLNEIYSLMETSESQDDIVLGISKQSVFLERELHDSSWLSNNPERKNVASQCKFSDTISGTPVSTKPTSSKRGEPKVDELDF